MASGEVNIIVSLARRVTRAEFIAQQPAFFIVGADALVRPIGPSRTLGPDALTLEDLSRLRSASNSLPPSFWDSTGPSGVGGGVGGPPASLIVLPVRKTQTVFPSMITIGRTPNNDIVLSDISISKFHAYLKIEGETVEIYDAGSRNGTFVAERQLEPKGAPMRITTGAELRFGRRKFLLLGAGPCWDYIRSQSPGAK